MKIKTIIFGAGASAKSYMSNCSESREFIAIIDNDKQKEGMLIEGILVSSPALISQIEFDEIVITTQWATEVEHQLLNDLNIPRDKVTVPPKGHLKKQTPPFLHPPTRALGRHIISSLSVLADQHNVPLFVDFGTLLGIIRDGDIIEWDDDIDFSVPDGYFSELIEVIDEFVAANSTKLTWSVEKTCDKNARGMGVVLVFVDPENCLSQFKTTFSVREFTSGNSVHLPSLGMWYSPEEHFLKVAPMEWNGVTIFTPFNPKAYLTFVYGEDWPVPKKNISFTDYANLQTVEFNSFKEAGLNVEQS